MSLKGKTRICLLVFFCVAALAEAFNSERKSSGDASIHLHNGQHEDIKDAQVVPATSEETTQKRNTRIRRARQRHERNRREKEDEDAMQEIFQRPQIDPNSIPNNFGFNSNGNGPSASGQSSNNVFSSSSNGYSYEPPRQQFSQPQPMYFQSPQSYAGPQYLPSALPPHNTIVPNGNQVNNYYSSQFPTYSPASNPWSGVPNYFPAPFYYGPFLVIPIPICYPNNNVDNQPTPPPGTTVPVTLDTRIGDNINNNVNNNINRPPFNFDKYYNTSTGVDLNPVAPARQPSVTPPPALHISSDNANNQAADQAPPRPRPPLRTTQRPPLRTTQRPPMRATTRRPALQPGRPLPSTQRPPLRPVVQEPSQDLDGPGSESSLGEACVTAIIRCCNRVPRPFSVPRCFEISGCPGAFFSNPCESEAAMAISRAANEFQQNGLLFL